MDSDLPASPAPLPDNPLQITSPPSKSSSKADRASPPSARRMRRRRPPAWWRHTFASLSQRNYRYMWLGMLAFMSGVQMSFVAMGYLAYDLTGSASLLGFVHGAQAVPMLVLSPFGGVVADRFDRKRAMQIGQVTAGAIALLVALAIWTGYIHWSHLVLMGFAYGTVFAFTMPARQATVPELVDRRHLGNAVALNGALLSATFLIAPGIGGALYALSGPGVVFFVIAGLGFISVLLTGALPPLMPSRRKVRSVLQEIGEGLKYVGRSPLIRLLLLMTLVTASLAIPFRFVLPVFVVDVYERGPEALGLLVSIMGAGSLAGALVLAAMRGLRRGMALVLASMASGAALLAVAAVPIYAAAAVLMAVLGVADAGRRTLTHSLMMEHGDPEYRGRTMSLYLMSFGMVPLVVVPVGVAIEQFDGRVVIGAMAVLLLAVSAAILVTQRDLRELR